jgi:glycyl-tRNA synthetase (class II)
LYKRNYRRWPIFCNNTNCRKMFKKDWWTLMDPCSNTCKEDKCRRIMRKDSVKCPTCIKKLNLRYGDISSFNKSV